MGITPSESTEVESSEDDEWLWYETFSRVVGVAVALVYLEMSGVNPWIATVALVVYIFAAVVAGNVLKAVDNRLIE